MKKIDFLILALVIMLLFSTITGTAAAQSPTPQPVKTTRGDQVVIANTYRLYSGETLDGNLVVIGSTAFIEKIPPSPRECSFWGEPSRWMARSKVMSLPSVEW